jgi:indole-3-acetate monooxygenase
VIEFANEIEGLLNVSETITQEKQSEIHDYSSDLVESFFHNKFI